MEGESSLSSGDFSLPGRGRFSLTIQLVVISFQAVLSPVLQPLGSLLFPGSGESSVLVTGESPFSRPW